MKFRPGALLNIIEMAILLGILLAIYMQRFPSS